MRSWRTAWSRSQTSCRMSEQSGTSSSRRPIVSMWRWTTLSAMTRFAFWTSMHSAWRTGQLPWWKTCGFLSLSKEEAKRLSFCADALILCYPAGICISSSTVCKKKSPCSKQTWSSTRCVFYVLYVFPLWLQCSSNHRNHWKLTVRYLCTAWLQCARGLMKVLLLPDT